MNIQTQKANGICCAIGDGTAHMTGITSVKRSIPMTTKTFRMLLAQKAVKPKVESKGTFNTRSSQSSESVNNTAMKTFKLLMLSIVALFTIECTEDPIIDESSFHKTFVSQYVTPTSLVAYVDYYGMNESTECIHLKVDGPHITSSNKAFDTIARSYHDLAYNRRSSGHIFAINDSLSSIHVITMDDFDAFHPAGSDVSDLIECQYASYYTYIQRGYKDFTYPCRDEFFDSVSGVIMSASELFKEKLNNIHSGNTKLMAPELVLLFTQQPETKGKHTFHITIYMAGGNLETDFEYEF